MLIGRRTRRLRFDERRVALRLRRIHGRLRRSRLRRVRRAGRGRRRCSLGLAQLALSRLDGGLLGRRLLVPEHGAFGLDALLVGLGALLVGRNHRRRVLAGSRLLRRLRRQGRRFRAGSFRFRPRRRRLLRLSGEMLELRAELPLSAPGLGRRLVDRLGDCVLDGALHRRGTREPNLVQPRLPLLSLPLLSDVLHRCAHLTRRLRLHLELVHVTPHPALLYLLPDLLALFLHHGRLRRLRHTRHLGRRLRRRLRLRPVRRRRLRLERLLLLLEPAELLVLPLLVLLLRPLLPLRRPVALLVERGLSRRELCARLIEHLA